MRNEIVTPGAGELTYEIRNIVTVAEKVQRFGVKINWENIGDPIVKGETIPLWMKEIVAVEAMNDESYAYCPTRGVLETREFICEITNKRGGAQITPEDIIFFNGLGDAIAKVYGNLRAESRVLMPSPTYTTHSIGEAAHANAVPVCYRLKHEDNWYPDMEDLECHVKYNPQISGIMIINPDNPTGMVYPPEVLKQIVDIARKYDLFLIADEVYNGERDPRFKKFVNSILSSKMNEVCSTTLPQRCLPAVMKHPQYQNYLKERITRYERMSNIMFEALSRIPELSVNRTNGAFYMAVPFKKGVLNHTQTLPIQNPEIRELVEGIVNQPGVAADKRFVYYILAHTGICVVPLSSFNTGLLGFRVTLLERDEEECRKIYRTLTENIAAYLAS